MNSKTRLSTLILLSLVTTPVTLLAAEPKPHDHQATKGIIIPKQSKDTADEDCDSTETQVNTEAKETESQDQKAKCSPKKSSTQNHDHRKMKNL